MRLGFLEDGSRFSEYKTPGLVGSPESWRCLYPGQLRCAEDQCGIPTRRTKSWKRGSERRLSNTGSTFRLIIRSSRSSRPFPAIQMRTPYYQPAHRLLPPAQAARSLILRTLYNFLAYASSSLSPRI